MDEKIHTSVRVIRVAKQKGASLFMLDSEHFLGNDSTV